MSDTRLEVEERIMECWKVVDDIKIIWEEFSGRTYRAQSGNKMDADELCSILLGMQKLYDRKFTRLFESYEKMLDEMREENEMRQEDDQTFIDRLSDEIPDFVEWVDKDWAQDAEDEIASSTGKTEVKEEEKLKETQNDLFDSAIPRIDIIGQNGNDGDHYDKIDSIDNIRIEDGDDHPPPRPLFSSSTAKSSAPPIWKEIGENNDTK